MKKKIEHHATNIFINYNVCWWKPKHNNDGVVKMEV